MFEKRSDELELIDTGDYTAEEYEGCLRELRRVNYFLGDIHALKKTLLSEIENENFINFRCSMSVLARARCCARLPNLRKIKRGESCRVGAEHAFGEVDSGRIKKICGRNFCRARRRVGFAVCRRLV